ncbi:MAG: 4-hydroxy-tetrahydrodipicolinate synthase [Desulfofustis sp.]|nr:4-hydroxy-tetrahydrodipicolinate synthase [Desulfofustis sp.]
MSLDGLFTALITPFKADESVDKDALRNIIEFQIQNRVDAVVPCTVTGENATLSHIEHEWVVEWTVRYVNKRTRVIAATGSNNTREAIRLSLHAQKVGADAVLLVTPYLNLPSQRGMYLHFRAIAENITLPCILHNLTSQTNVNLNTATVLKLVEDCPNIAGFCEVADNLDQAWEIRAHTPPSFKIYSGRDDQAADFFQNGGNGLFSIAANIVPDRMQRLVRLALEKNSGEAQKIAAELSELIALLQQQPDPVPVKTLAAHLKFCQESFRLPICRCEDKSLLTSIRSVIKKLPIRS